MRAFACDHCHGLIFFENSVCLTCGSPQAFHRETAHLNVLYRQGGGLGWLDSVGQLWVPCANLHRAGCNWLALAGAQEGLCDCCQLTRTRPADTDEDGMQAFARTEAAKRRLVFQLDSLGLPTTPRTVDPVRGLAFDLLSSRGGPVTTGHDSGVITIDLAEGDDVHREQLRVQLDEPYRTLLGHLRHEIGHWYWEVLVSDSPFHDRFRELFGDESVDYADALQAHYGSSATGDWAKQFVSHYASAHPWEDWAETFAHYLHIRDELQTMAAWGVTVAGPDLELSVAWDAPVAASPVDEPDEFGGIIRTWVPLTFALNASNRSMGKGDLYPFVLVPPVIDKLRFVHNVVTAAR